MKKIQCINWIKEFMKEMGRPCTTMEILDYVNGRTTHGMTRKSLCNVMAKNFNDFVRVGSDLRVGNVSGTYPIALWDLSEIKN